jgi:hypothetical protein
MVFNEILIVFALFGDVSRKFYGRNFHQTNISAEKFSANITSVGRNIQEIK